MVGRITPDKISQILRAPFIDENGKKEKMSLTWRYSFLAVGGMTLLTVLLMVLSIIDKSNDWASGIGLLILLVPMNLFLILKYRRIRVISPQIFNKAIEKYGRENLISQLADSDTEAFFVSEDYYENLMIITSDFIISANDFILAFDDIKMISFYPHHLSEDRINKATKDIYRQVALKNIYQAIITMKNGSHKTEYISIKRSDIKTFINSLRRHSPEATFRCPDLEDPEYE